MRKDELVRDLVARAKLILRQLEEMDVQVHPEHAAVAVLRACSTDSRFVNQVQHLLGVGMELTLDNVQAALMTCEQVGTMQAPLAFQAKGTSTVPPHASRPLDEDNPVAAGMAAMSKQLQSLASQLGRQQQQQKKGKGGPDRQKQGQGRKAPYQKGGGQQKQVNKPQQCHTHQPDGHTVETGQGRSGESKQNQKRIHRKNEP